MVDDILELVLDLLFDGTTALADAQKVPLALRALLYVLLTAALMGIAAYLAWQGVQENSILLLLLASGILIGSLVLLAVNLKKLRRPREPAQFLRLVRMLRFWITRCPAPPESAGAMLRRFPAAAIRRRPGPPRRGWPPLPAPGNRIHRARFCRRCRAP